MSMREKFTEDFVMEINIPLQIFSSQSRIFQPVKDIPASQGYSYTPTFPTHLQDQQNKWASE
jgi:hypothetical protein